MSISNINRETFVHTLTVPWAEPLPVLVGEPADKPWEYAGEALRHAGNYGATAVVRLATPAITGFGLGKNWVDKHPKWSVGAPVAAMGGALVGTVVGAAGILFDLGGMAWYTVGAAAAVACAGMEAWAQPEPQPEPRSKED